MPVGFAFGNSTYLLAGFASDLYGFLGSSLNSSAVELSIQALDQLPTAAFVTYSAYMLLRQH